MSNDKTEVTVKEAVRTLLGLGFFLSYPFALIFITNILLPVHNSYDLVTWMGIQLGGFIYLVVKDVGDRDG